MLSKVEFRKRKQQHRRNENQGKFDKSSRYNAAAARGISDKNDDSGDNIFAAGLSVMKGDDSTHDFES